MLRLLRLPLFLFWCCCCLLASAPVSSVAAERYKNVRSLESTDMCPLDETMHKDYVWYELDTALVTEQELDCNDDEWTAIGHDIEMAISQVDLWENGISIVDLNAHICHHHDRQKDPQRRQLRSRVISGYSFHLFYRGGGRCFFCGKDNTDRNSRREQRQLRIPGRQQPPSFTNRPLLDGVAQQRRQLRCGGCFNLDFSVDSNGTSITGTPYLDHDEYWESHGVRIKGTRGYTPCDQVRIYNTSYDPQGSHFYLGDPALGSPNSACPGGGPGLGVYGAPNYAGLPNPGANCDSQGNVLVIQEFYKTYADDNTYGGDFIFEFRYPVRLNQVGLMNMASGKGHHIKVLTEAGVQHRHNVHGYGTNSIETLQLDHKEVVQLEVVLRGPGAVRFLDFCHDCGDDNEQLAQEITAYYGPATARSSESAESVHSFEQLLPATNQILSMAVQASLNQTFAREATSCLFEKIPSVDVTLTVSTPRGASTCHLFDD